MEWPAQSSDLSPLDFFFLGVTNDDVYARKFTNLFKFDDIHQARSTEDREWYRIIEKSRQISRFDDFGMLRNCSVLLKIHGVIQPFVFHMKAHSSDNNP